MILNLIDEDGGSIQGKQTKYNLESMNELSDQVSIETK